MGLLSLTDCSKNEQGRKKEMIDKKKSKMYANVPADQVNRFFAFRESHPHKQTTIDGVQWSYLDIGQGKITLLLLTGALGTTESSWQTIDYLSGMEKGTRYRVIAPAYPAIPTATGLVDGIAAILDREGIARIHLIGGSAGGAVAQVFIRRHADKTASMILSHTLYPDPERGAKIAGALRWMALVPAFILRAIVLSRLSGLTTDRPELALTNAYLQEAMRYQLTKKDLLCLYRRTVDFDTRCTFTPHDLDNWPGSVLLMMSDDDPSTPQAARTQLQALYPQAQTHLFHGTGHLAAVLKKDEYYGLIDRFVQSCSAAKH